MPQRVVGVEGIVAEAIGNGGGRRHDNGDEGDGREVGDADDQQAETHVDQADGAQDGPAQLEVDGDGRRRRRRHGGPAANGVGGRAGREGRGRGLRGSPGDEAAGFSSARGAQGSSRPAAARASEGEAREEDGQQQGRRAGGSPAAFCRGHATDTYSAQASTKLPHGGSGYCAAPAQTVGPASPRFPGKLMSVTTAGHLGVSHDRMIELTTANYEKEISYCLSNERTTKSEDLSHRAQQLKKSGDRRCRRHGWHSRPDGTVGEAQAAHRNRKVGHGKRELACKAGASRGRLREGRPGSGSQRGG